jgi:hypothetical protein
MDATNRFFGFDTKDVLNCTSLPDLYQYKLNNLDTMSSIKLQIVDHGDDKFKIKALIHLEFLQEIINTQIDIIKYTKKS